VRVAAACVGVAAVGGCAEVVVAAIVVGVVVTVVGSERGTGRTARGRERSPGCHPPSSVASVASDDRSLAV